MTTYAPNIRLSESVVRLPNGQKTQPTHFNCTASKDNYLDWTIEYAFMEGKLDVEKTFNLPEKYDLSEEIPGWTVTNQWERGDCVAHALVKGVLPMQIAKQRDCFPPEFSTLFLWIASKETDTIEKWPTTFLGREGTTLKAGLTVLKNFGCVKECDFGIEREGFIMETRSSFYKKANVYKIDSYFNLHNDLNHIKWWLYQVGPVAARIQLDQKFLQCYPVKGEQVDSRTEITGEPQIDNAMEKYKKMLYRSRGHAVCIVGYRTDESGNLWFKIRNSWGEKFGAKGHVWMHENYARKTLRETYGITMNI